MDWRRGKGGDEAEEWKDTSSMGTSWWALSRDTQLTPHPIQWWH